MGVFAYKVVDIGGMPVSEQEHTLNTLGTTMWKLVSVENGKAYLAQGPEAYDQVHPDYGVDKAGKDSKNYRLEQPTNSRLFESISTHDGDDPHAHRVRVVVLEDESIGDFWVEKVFDHDHDVKELGMLTKAAGHTHTFDVDLGMKTDAEQSID